MASQRHFHAYEAVLSVALISVLCGPARLDAVEDGFRIELGYHGEYVGGEGTGYGDEKWYYSDQTNWWSQWFYNAPYDPNRKKIIETRLTISLLDPTQPGRVEVAYNWSTGAWSRLGKTDPPLPSGIADLASEKKYVARLPFVVRKMPVGFVPQGPLAHSLKIPQYNPEWVSIDVRGENVVVEGWIKHECLPKGLETQACCLSGGGCIDLPPEDCEAVPVELLDPVTGEGTGIFVVRPGSSQGANTDCSTVDCPDPAVEIDAYESPGRIELSTPLGAEVVELTGPVEIHVYFEGLEEGDAQDDDGDGLDEVTAELVEMNLVGSSVMLGEVRVRLQSDVPSLGQIAEQANATRGVLDLQPFAEGGVADSFFDVWPEIVVGEPGQVLRTIRPKRLTGVLTQKPPAPCDGYEDNYAIELVDATGAPTGYILGRVRLGLECQACCLPDGTCEDLPLEKCRERGGTPQGPDTDCVTASCGSSTDCDWNPDMPHKMHRPQLPDLSPAGVDVDAMGLVLADDFRCTATGPISRIHVWASFAGDILPSDGPEAMTLVLTIYSDVPATNDSWSRPGERLWTRLFKPGEYTVRRAHDGPEGWYDPVTDTYQPENHRQAYKYNFCIDNNAFSQQEGTIYWLAIEVQEPANTVHRFGWKTTKPELRWNDDAVYRAAGASWLPLTYPKDHEYAERSLDLAFVISGGEEAVPTYDLGDAPDSSNSHPGIQMLAYPSGVVGHFPTVYQAGSPPYGPIHLQHGYSEGIWLGFWASRESEADLGPDEDGFNNLDPAAGWADGDMYDDGLLFYPITMPHCGQTHLDYRVTVGPGTTVTDIYLNVWCDWNRDGDWNDTLVCPDGVQAPEWAVQNEIRLAPPGGAYVFATPSFMCWHPETTGELDPIWVRITIAEKPWVQTAAGPPVGGSGPEGGYQYGETEDYLIYPQEEPGEPVYDWGDAPDWHAAPGYPTLSDNNGARHVLAGPWFGDKTGVPDADADGQPDADALGDDGDGNDDEEGVSIPPLVQGETAVISVEVGGGGGVVQAWIDFDGDMTWQAGEKVFDGFLPNGVHPINVAVPSTATAGLSFARFRISTKGGLSPGGAARDGEVEDHEVSIQTAPLYRKWVQRPDLTQNGIDIRIDQSDGKVRWLADDFECTTANRITEICLWGSWKHDEKGKIEKIHVSIHPDDPVGSAGYDPQNRFSKPGPEVLWSRSFEPGEFTEASYHLVSEPGEWWWDPATGELIRGGDTEVWRLDLSVDPNEAFAQRGSLTNPIIYWLMVQVETTEGEFGWKTRRWPDHYMDDAVWDVGVELPRIWSELRYPKNHPYYALDKNSIDMAFRLGYTGEVIESPTMKPGSATQCPVVETQCPVAETRCPPVETQCPTADTRCPVVRTKCPPLGTLCPVVETGCPLVRTRCPVMETRCPPIPTECPPLFTRCPPIETKCPPIETKCPPVETQCPAVPTECPPVETRCPPIETKCPPAETQCPAVPTECPPVETRCPPIETKCPLSETQCPAVTTQCPPVETECPVDPVVTQCPAVETRCPPVRTKCPATETECPAAETKCPPVETECPIDPVVTQCPAVETKCPPVRTKCPPTETACPAADTQCPVAETKCPAVTTQCPPVETQCPIDPVATQCPAVETKCPPVQTKCPPTETACPAADTQCPPAETKCPVAETKCPVLATKCPVVRTQCPCYMWESIRLSTAPECPAIDVACPSVVAMCPPEQFVIVGL